MISVKNYFCPLCKSVEEHSTNHFGEIYCRCKTCGRSLLYFEGEKFEGCNKSVFKLVYYYLNLENEHDAIEYELIENNCKTLGYKKWKNHFYTFTKIKQMDMFRLRSGDVNVYNKDTFDNQYISDLGRIFDWEEMVYPNKRIKEGYYLLND